eukprot:TRINITY_DN297_c0_g2_i5.p1 TRINITY_DN297_c0_g2~~TRINITY_DN297_c0_g2_i5.p1  ORF type:complete len:764 (+),score=292.56 TRINITY_DN297_c0_g2_i5:51-2342(+)
MIFTHNVFLSPSHSIVFTLKGLEKKPLAELENTSHLISSRRLNSLPTKEQGKLRKLHRNLASICSIRGYNLKSFFTDWDKQNTGYVTYHQFMQGLNGFQLSQSEIDLLLKKYASKDDDHRSIGGVGGKVNYRDLHDVVEKLVRSSERTDFEFGTEDALRSSVRVRRSAASPKKTRNTNSNAEQVEQVIREIIIKNKLRLEEYFRDFDNLRLGTVGQSQLGTVLGTCKIQLTGNQLELLQEKYKDQWGRFKYKEFTKNLNQVFETPRLSKTLDKSTKKTTKGGSSTTSGAQTFVEARPLQQISKQEAYEAIVVMRKLQKFVANQRLTLTPLFYDWDKRRTGVVTPAQFTRILQIGKIDVSPAETEALIRKYTISEEEGLATSGMVNYAAFIKDAEAKAWSEDASNAIPQEREVIFRPLKNTEFDFAESSGGTLGSSSSSSEEDDMLLDEVIEEIQKKVVPKRIRVDEFFRDYDKLRRGVITFNQFRNCLNIIGIDLTEKEYQVLTSEYRSTKETGDFVDYRRFADDVDSTFTVKGLEKSPRKEVKPLTIDLSHEKENRKVSPAVYMVLKRLRKRVTERGIIVENFYQDIDKLRKGYVTQAQFRQGLSFLEFKVSEKETKQLINEYKQKNGLVDYVAFAAAVYGGDRSMKDTVTFEEHGKKHLHRTRNAKELKKKEEARNMTLEEILSDLHMQSVRTKVRPGEFFADFDKLRSGKVSTAKFETSLSLCRFVITQADLETLINAYLDPKTKDTVKYRDFVQDVMSA